MMKKMSRKIAHSRSFMTYFCHSTDLSLPAILLCKVSILIMFTIQESRWSISYDEVIRYDSFVFLIITYFSWLSNFLTFSCWVILVFWDYKYRRGFKSAVFPADSKRPPWNFLYFHLILLGIYLFYTISVKVDSDIIHWSVFQLIIDACRI